MNLWGCYLVVSTVSTILSQTGKHHKSRTNTANLEHNHLWKFILLSWSYNCLAFSLLVEHPIIKSYSTFSTGSKSWHAPLSAILEDSTSEPRLEFAPKDLCQGKSVCEYASPFIADTSMLLPVRLMMSPKNTVVSLYPENSAKQRPRGNNSKSSMKQSGVGQIPPDSNLGPCSVDAGRADIFTLMITAGNTGHLTQLKP